MFNKDFYPTPEKVVERMLFGIDVQGKVILEPSAGSGNIVDYLNANGAKQVLACEIEPKLQQMLHGKCNLIESDFLNVTREDVSHIDLIVMNPPFSCEEKHIKHAWNIAPDGCLVISLCNNNLIERGWYSSQKEIKELVSTYGRSENFFDCFKTGERATTASIGCLWLQKPMSEQDDFASYFSMEEEEDIRNVEGIMPYNEIYEVVSRFTGAIKLFDEVQNLNRQINDAARPIGGGNIVFGAQVKQNNVTTEITKDQYLRDLQKTAWRSVFAKLGADKYLTSKVREQLNKAIETQTNIPFTMKNIYLFVSALVQTHGNRMNEALEEAFDHICSLSAKNTTAGEKWKTNSHYMINRTFIDNYICEYDARWGGTDYVKMSYRSNCRLDDITKAMCYLTGTKYEDTTPLYEFINRNKLEWGKWYSWGFFEVRGYKKGTMHFKFQDEKVWQMFNQKVGEIKGWELHS